MKVESALIFALEPYIYVCARACARACGVCVCVCVCVCKIRGVLYASERRVWHFGRLVSPRDGLYKYHADKTRRMGADRPTGPRIDQSVKWEATAGFGVQWVWVVILNRERNGPSLAFRPGLANLFEGACPNVVWILNKVFRVPMEILKSKIRSWILLWLLLITELLLMYIIII
jgi:hypothetical protein